MQTNPLPSSLRFSLGSDGIVYNGDVNHPPPHLPTSLVASPNPLFASLAALGPVGFVDRRVRAAKDKQIGIEEHREVSNLGRPPYSTTGCLPVKKKNTLVFSKERHVR